MNSYTKLLTTVSLGIFALASCGGGGGGPKATASVVDGSNFLTNENGATPTPSGEITFERDPITNNFVMLVDGEEPPNWGFTPSAYYATDFTEPLADDYTLFPVAFIDEDGIAHAFLIENMASVSETEDFYNVELFEPVGPTTGTVTINGIGYSYSGYINGEYVSGYGDDGSFVYDPDLNFTGSFDGGAVLLTNGTVNGYDVTADVELGGVSGNAEGWTAVGSDNYVYTNGTFTGSAGTDSAYAGAWAY